MKNHTLKAYLNALEKRPVIMTPPAVLRDTVERIEAKSGVTLAAKKEVTS